MRMNRLEVLSKAEIETLHGESLKVLEGTGVKVFDQDALKMLSSSGVDVDFENNIAKFPENFVEEALKSCPKGFTALNRDKQNSVEIGGDTIYIASGFYASYVLKDGERIQGTTEDVANFARISDCLKNVDAVGVEVLPQNVPAHVSELYACSAMLNNSTKHLFFSPNTRFSARGLIEIIKAVAEEEDLLKTQIATFQSSPTSPLTWESDSLGVLIESSKAGIACNVLPEPMAGATSPITLAAVLLVHNAEFLSGLVISQLVRKGVPIIYGYAPTIFDMREASPIIASPETIALRVGHAQMARFYGLPVHCIAPDSDAQCHDEQMAWEKLITFLAALNSGVNILINCGMFSTGLIASYEQLIIDDEMLGFLLRVIKGIEVNAETLAIDLIEKVGPRGHFLNQMHTLKHIRTEYWLPELSNRATYDNWLRTGGKDIVTKSREKAQKYLREYKPPELEREKRKKIQEIIKKFEKMKG